VSTAVVMGDSDKSLFSLQWNDYNKELLNSFQKLRKSEQVSLALPTFVEQAEKK
jgi:hypothetical protein